MRQFAQTQQPCRAFYNMNSRAQNQISVTSILDSCHSAKRERKKKSQQYAFVPTVPQFLYVNTFYSTSCEPGPHIMKNNTLNFTASPKKLISQFPVMTISSVTIHNITQYQ